MNEARLEDIRHGSGACVNQSFRRYIIKPFIAFLLSPSLTFHKLGEQSARH
jgi:hypothetical protein